MADDIRQRITSSIFSKLNAQGHQETYVAHIKIWEDAPDEGGQKPRYIIIARSSDGGGFIHKSKQNSNSSFSVGKTWKINDLRAVEVVHPLAFNITLARTYKWQTEDERGQANFVVSLIKLFRSISRGAPLQIVGIRDPDAAPVRHPVPPPAPSFTRMERAPTPPNGAPLATTPTRRPYMNGRAEIPQSRSAEIQNPPPIPPVPATAIPPVTPSRPSSRPRRPISPPTLRPESTNAALAYTATEVPERASTPPIRNRPGTPSSTREQLPPSSLRPGRTRRPSNASSTRSFISSVSTPIPPIALSGSPDQSNLASIPPVPPPPVTAIPSASGFSRRPNGSAFQSTSTSVASLDTPAAPISSLSSASRSAYDPGSSDTSRQAIIYSGPDASSRTRKMPGDVTSTPASAQGRREPNARVSFFDPANQATLDRLLSGDIALQDDWDEGTGEEVEVAEEAARAMLTSFEEMLEGYEWASGDILSSTARGTTDLIEARLIDELTALDKANIHSFIESDDRVNIVLKYLDDALKELDGLDSVISSYKIHLNTVGEDITFIQSQDRGLQVQTQNQRALLTEVEELLHTVQVDTKSLLKLTQASLENNIEQLEEAATQLYKALQAGRDRDMAATMERLDEYRTYNVQFCKRLFDFLKIMVDAQSTLLLGSNGGVLKPSKGRPQIVDHKQLEVYLGRYGGLMLYLKEMDESTYARLCAEYFSAASKLHGTQVRAFLVACHSMIKKTGDEDVDGLGATSPAASRAAASVRRAGTIVRSPLEARRERREQGDGDLRACDAFGLVLEAVAPAVYSEEEFIADFLQINDAALTFADYMGLENYFRRQAARSAGLSSNTMKLVRGAMELIFGFLPAELKTWLDTALSKDSLQIVGMIGCLERFLTEAEERGNTFLLGLLEKQHVRLKTLFDRNVAERIKGVEDTKLTTKKRNGVAPFIRAFPAYVGRVENQLIGADTLEIRQVVDVAYDRIVEAMFSGLRQMAKMDGEGEDKGQLNYHVILIENMHHFVAEMSQLDIGSISSFLQKAQAIYDENLTAYVKLVLRRPFAKIIEYFDGIERMLKTTAPTEIANSSYSKSAAKKVVKEYNSKDVRKHVDALFKRVEKHFTEASEKATTEQASSSTGIAPGTVMVGVWKACEEELLRMTDYFAKRIAQCYVNTGVALEYTPGDVEAAFKRHRVAS